MLICLLIISSFMEIYPSVAHADLVIHFIDVGQADASVVLCDGKSLMIDGGNSKDSSLIYSYLQNTLELSHLDYMIATHPHEDHVGGLAAALNACTIGEVFSPVLEYKSEAFSSFLYYVGVQEREIIIPYVGQSFMLGSAKVQFLSPVKNYSDMNDNSIVVRIVYGNTSFLFTGDAGWDSEHDIVEAGYELESTLLKVGHHGSNSSSSYIFLREVSPLYAVISVGKRNQYGHPSEDVLSRLRDIGAEVYRTDLQGDVICVSDGDSLSFWTEK